VATRRKIAILLHETDSREKSKGHFIWALCDEWQSNGIEIEILRGPERHVDADLLIPHVNLTVLPPEYVDLFRRYPRVINRSLHDISKRAISRNLLSAGDDYTGPVIVKTDLNYGGRPEARLARRGVCGALNALRLRLSKQGWRDIRSMTIGGYKVFPALRAVPADVFENKALVVERFLPEVENGTYYLRVYLFMGDRGYCVRVGSTEPIVKQMNIVSREEAPIPEELMAARREMGVDYGKMDFAVNEGRVVLFDLNRTPGIIQPEERMRTSARNLAPGIDSIWGAGAIQ
jgi:hypothetical protein